MKVYEVGGAVRDALLGLAVKDRDYVVVGSTVDEMLAEGFRPVGKDFPVFLHPQTHEEYALARTERKVASGYKGFAVFVSIDVTLEEDLSRRDLTINAIAKDEKGHLIDPYHGVDDLNAKTLRHVSDAFTEDPVRILRAARFAARFNEFSIAPETNVLMQKMVQAGEVDALVSERVWQELAKGLMSQKPSRMFEVLRNCGALKRIFPELDALWCVLQPPQYHPEINMGIHVMMAIDYAATHNYSLPIRFAILVHNLGKGTTSAELLPCHDGHEERSVNVIKNVTKRLRVPNDCKELAQLVARFHGKLHQAPQMKPLHLLKFLLQLDAIRQPARLKDFLKACEADLRGRIGMENCATPAANIMLQVLEAVINVDAGSIAQQFSDPEKIKNAVFEARLKAVTHKFS